MVEVKELKKEMRIKKTRTPDPEMQAAAEEVMQRLSEKFAALFSKTMEEIADELHAHMDEHFEDVEALLEEGFGSIHEHLNAHERLEKLEKRLDRVENTGKRFVT